MKCVSGIASCGWAEEDVFTCEDCGKRVCFCQGGLDDHTELCAECFAKRERYPGWAIRHYRRKRRWTVERLAREAGISKGFLSRIENGLRDEETRTLVRIAKALRVHPGVFFPQEEGRTSPAPAPPPELTAHAVPCLFPRACARCH
jgi:DNA-binding XRE family transcriptional regulator